MLQSFPVLFSSAVLEDGVEGQVHAAIQGSLDGH